MQILLVVVHWNRMELDPLAFELVKERRTQVRTTALTIYLALVLPAGIAGAQTAQPDKGSLKQPTGSTAPEAKGQLQPQGWTGPIDTSAGGAPPESPQGQSPPGMQAAPEGSSKTVVEPRK
jgi:hypothetical protein